MSVLYVPNVVTISYDHILLLNTGGVDCVAGDTSLEPSVDMLETLGAVVKIECLLLIYSSSKIFLWASFGRKR